MIKKRNQKRNLASITAWMLAYCSVLGLIGCGGGGSSGSHITYQTGTLSDSPVAGVSYRTDSTSGTTDSRGEFRYLANESVTFSLGSLELGQADGAQVINLFDLVGIDTLPTNARELSDQMWQDSNQPGVIQRVLNLAMLLQSLDRDNNPQNGIDIPSGISDLINASIDLSQNYWEFSSGGNGRDGTGLPGLLRAAAQANYLSPRDVTDAALAFEHVLAQMNHHISVLGNTVYTQDEGADGTIDFRRELSYTPFGDVALDLYDTDGNGIDDLAIAISYNANLRQTAYERDNDADGVIDRVTNTNYDSFGSVTRREVTESGTVTSVQAYTYDSVGRLITLDTNTTTTRTIEHWIVDEQGMRSTYEVDRGGDGTIDWRSVLQFNAQQRGDRWTRNEIDTNLDGIYDSLRTREFDAQGHLLSDRRDDDLDGVIDYSVTATYDNFGNQLTYEQDRDGNGADLINQYERSADGVLLSQQSDRQGDGIFESVTEYSYDAAGNKSMQESFADGATTPTSRSTWTYTEDNLRATYSYDGNADGIIDTFYRYTYTADGQLSQFTHDRGNDGIVDRIYSYEGWVEIGLAAYF